MLLIDTISKIISIFYGAVKNSSHCIVKNYWTRLCIKALQEYWSHKQKVKWKELEEDEVWSVDLHDVEHNADRCRDDHRHAFYLVAGTANSLNGKTDQHSSHHPDEKHTDQCSYHF